MKCRPAIFQASHKRPDRRWEPGSPRSDGRRRPHLKSLMALRGRRRLLGGGDEVRRKTMWQLSGEESVRVETRVYAEASLSGDELLVLSDVSLAHRARHR